MDLLISMKAEPLDKALETTWKMMTMPTAQSAGQFIAEFREIDKDKLGLLKQYAGILEQKLNKEIFRIDYTAFGFLLKKQVEQDIEYMQAWEKWVEFSRMIYDELSSLLDEELPEEPE